ncbi:hypothetical protein CR152_08255 [Massilia violaceinigra]|uniref:Uncharacterized protein n=1 Tax=Massilia violaceinigra TaxID=2045208 RepID=A0A2D2DHP8_9BURK|nr:hypothetical protein [Massilia violaceinigra]ATQ74510.1 hypothetical protein CR152_08255 [Massilia violaceinigra]
MQIIENSAILEAIGGSGKEDMKCEISTEKIGCEASFQQFLELSFEAFDEVQRWGGNLGRWLYDRIQGD